MKLRNILALLLTLAMVFSLAACSAAGAGEATETAATEAPAATEETAATEATEAPSSEPVQLHAWAWLTNVDGLYEAAAEYEQLTGIKIELTVDTIAAADILTNLTTTNESGDISSLPDIILMQDTDAYKNIANYPDLLYDVTSYLDWSQVTS